MQTAASHRTSKLRDSELHSLRRCSPNEEKELVDVVITTKLTNRRSSPAPGDLSVETRALTKRFGARTAVEDVNLQVRRGEVYGFLGPNGAGKTTTLRMLLGLARSTSGEARVLGLPPGDPRALAKIGMLVEGPGFYPYLSARDNLRVMARYAKVPSQRVDAALEAVELTHRQHDRYGSFSLGMKQRLGVASALLKEPELVILDEPTNGLDPAGMATMRRLIRHLSDVGHTVLLSSHLMGEVQQVCDRVGVIVNGRLLKVGTVDQLRSGGAVVVRAEPQRLAQEQARRLLGDDGVVVGSDGLLHLQIPQARAAEVNRELVAGGIDVHGLSWVEPSLEEVFFELTNDRGGQ